MRMEQGSIFPPPSQRRQKADEMKVEKEKILTWVSSNFTSEVIYLQSFTLPFILLHIHMCQWCPSKMAGTVIAFKSFIIPSNSRVSSSLDLMH